MINKQFLKAHPSLYSSYFNCNKLLFLITKVTAQNFFPGTRISRTALFDQFQNDTGTGIESLVF